MSAQPALATAFLRSCPWSVPAPSLPSAAADSHPEAASLVFEPKYPLTAWEFEKEPGACAMAQQVKESEVKAWQVDSWVLHGRKELTPLSCPLTSTGTEPFIGSRLPACESTWVSPASAANRALAWEQGASGLSIL